MIIIFGITSGALLAGALIYFIKLTINYDRNNYLEKMSFKESMDLTELPVITFHNNGNKLNFLLDTGANKCVINKSIISNLDYTKINKTASVYGMDGNSVDVSFISMNFSYKKKIYSSEFQVIDMQAAFDNIKKESGVTVNGIIGSAFFEKYKYVLDFSELIVYSKT